MRDLPEAAFLLTLRDPDPALERRARDIAARERDLGNARYERVRQALAARYGAAEDGVLLAKLAADIRAGRGVGPDLLPVLRAHARLRLEESNPCFIIIR
jgi:hypothetical protein